MFINLKERKKEMSQDLLNDLQRRMQGSLDALTHDFAGLRTGRASTALLDPVKVESYGNIVPINQVGTISAPDARMLSVQVWDQSMVKAVEKAIREAGLGLNPFADGNSVRVPLPDLSEERRKELVKVAKKYAETARVAVRNVRRDGMEVTKKMEKEGEISEDEQRNMNDSVQKLTDKHIQKIEDLLKKKETDILHV